MPRKSEIINLNTNLFSTKEVAQNGLELDYRPHFEILGEKHQHLHPHSEEEIWMPIE